jgi:hypothetical protein
VWFLAETYGSGGSSWGTSSVVIADVNGDGKPDMVVANTFAENVAVLRGNGDGTFRPAVTYPTGDGTGRGRDTALAVADMNRDGKLDIIVALHGAVGILLGNGDGTFQPQVTYSIGSILANSIAVADLNHDGKLDVVAEGCVECGGDRLHDVVAVLLGNGDGTLQPAVDYDPGGGEYINGSTELGAKALAIADVNGDGKVDLLVANLFDGCFSSCSNGSVGVLLGNGDGTFQPAVTYNSYGYYPYSLAVLDANKDGKPDVAVVNEESGVVALLLGNGDGTFWLKQSFSSGDTGPNSATVADVNGDGNPDLLVANYATPEASVGVLLGNGDGTFQPAVNYDSGAAEAVSVAAADLTGRGMTDLVVSHATGVLGVLLHVGSMATTAALVSAQNPSVFGQAVTFTATVSSGSGTPTGTVVFWDGPAKLGSASLANGFGTMTLSLSAGTHTIRAAYEGSLKYQSSASTPINQIVSVASTATKLTSSSNPAAPGQKLTYNARVSSQYGGAAGGTVTFRDGGATLATVSVTKGLAAYHTTYQSFGAHSINASYSGDANNNGSAAATLTEYIADATNTAVTTSGSPTYAGQPVTFTATVTSSYGNVPDGEMVAFKDGNTTLGSAPLAGGRAAYTTGSLAAKPHTIFATYAGDGAFYGSASKVTQVVLKYPTTTMLVSSANPSRLSQAVTFTATVTSSGGPTATGMVRFWDGAKMIGTGTLSSGVAQLKISTLAVGTHAITAQYLSDAKDDKSTSPVVNQVVQ